MEPLLNKLTMADSSAFADVRMKQKLYFYLIANTIGVVLMLVFGVVLSLKGKILIPVTDFMCSVLLVIAYVHLRVTKDLYKTCIIASFAFTGFLLVHLVSGGTDSSDPVWYFVFPPVVLYLLGRRMGLIFSLAVAVPALAVLILLFAGFEVAGYTITFMLRILISYLMETFLFYIMETQRANAQKEVKKLSGLLPICASCKKIRDDKGYWNQIEEYIQTNSDAQFSHGMCPECTEKYYPGLDNDENQPG